MPRTGLTVEERRDHIAVGLDHMDQALEQLELAVTRFAKAGISGVAQHTLNLRVPIKSVRDIVKELHTV